MTYRIITARQPLWVFSAWLTLLTGLLSLHFVLIPMFLQGTGGTVTYAPVSIGHADAVYTHIPVIRKLLSGIPAFSDQFVPSDVTPALSVWPRWPYLLLAPVGLPLIDHLDALPIVATVLLTPLNASVLYILIVRISGSRSTGVLGTTAILGFRELFVLQPWHWINVDEVRRILVSPIFSNAMVNPQVSFLFMCTALIVLHRLIRKPDRLVAFANGLIYGLSFYTYVYLWTYLSGLYVVAGLYLLLRGKRQHFSWLVQSIFLGLLMSLIYWRDAATFSTQPGFVDFRDRFAIGRHPDLQERFANLRPHLVTLMGLGLVVIKQRRSYILLFMMTMTAEILWKAPIVIGYDVQSLHYAYHIYSVCAGITLIIVAANIMLRLTMLKRVSSSILSSYCIVAFMLFVIGYRSYEYSSGNFHDYSVPSDINDAYNYINLNTSPGSVVLAADPVVNMRVRNIAPVYVYVPSGYGTFVTTEEMLQRAAEMMHFYSITPDYMLGHLHGDDSTRRPLVTGMIIPEFYFFNGSLRYPTFLDRQQAIQDAYDSSDTGALTYPVDIVWFGPYERDMGQSLLDDQIGLELIYGNESVKLYQVTSRDALDW